MLLLLSSICVWGLWNSTGAQFKIYSCQNLSVWVSITGATWQTTRMKLSEIHLLLACVWGWYRQCSSLAGGVVCVYEWSPLVSSCMSFLSSSPSLPTDHYAHTHTQRGREEGMYLSACLILSFIYLLLPLCEFSGRNTLGETTELPVTSRTVYYSMYT